MRTHLRTLLAFLLCTFITPFAFAEKAVNDDFAVDGTSTTDAKYFGSSGSNAIEVNPNSIGLVSGSSGRQKQAEAFHRCTDTGRRQIRAYRRTALSFPRTCIR